MVGVTVVFCVPYVKLVFPVKVISVTKVIPSVETIWRNKEIPTVQIIASIKLVRSVKPIWSTELVPSWVKAMWSVKLVLSVKVVGRWGVSSGYCGLIRFGTDNMKWNLSSDGNAVRRFLDFSLQILKLEWLEPTVIKFVISWVFSKGYKIAIFNSRL